jgi:MscS family membrane protein
VATSFLNRGLSRLVGTARRRLHKNSALPDPEVLLKPVRLLLLALIIYWTLSRLRVPLVTRVMWSGAAQVITVAACVWLIILATGAGERVLHSQLRKLRIAGTTSVLRLGRRLVDVLVVFAGVIVILRHFGVNTTAALAGLGVGGIAVALAAQKTLENVIGGVSLIMDKAVRVGEVLSVGDVQGTVEDIGLRSTRIRTSDRTLVNLPNGRVATMSLEDMSSRDKFWFHPTLCLRHGTTAAQMQEVLDGVRSLLNDSRLVEQKTIRVRLIRYAQSSLDVEVYAYVLVPDQNQFLQIQEGLLLGIMNVLEAAGVEIAVPVQGIVLPGASASSSDDLQALARKSSGSS